MLAAFFRFLVVRKWKHTGVEPTYEITAGVAVAFTSILWFTNGIIQSLRWRKT